MNVSRVPGAPCGSVIGRCFGFNVGHRRLILKELPNERLENFWSGLRLGIRLFFCFIVKFFCFIVGLVHRSRHRSRGSTSTSWRGCAGSIERGWTEGRSFSQGVFSSFSRVFFPVFPGVFFQFSCTVDFHTFYVFL